MKSIVFIVSKLSQPRCIKRIRSIVDCGYPYKVYGYEDGSYNTDLNGLPFSITEVLSSPKCDTFCEKVKANIYPFRTIKRIWKSNPDAVFYVFGYELAKILFLLGCRNYIYEEADINSAKFTSKIRRNIAIKLDKKIAMKSLLTVYTSEGFVDFLFNNKKKPNYVIVPNKLSSYFNEIIRDRVFKAVNPSHLKFGFIGLIRYPKTIFKFASIIANKYPQHEFHFFGGLSGGLKIPEDLGKCQNIIFHGPFANPEDLEAIYSMIDLNIACYDTSSAKYAINVKVAEPNKLYESIFFQVPIVVSADTYVGKRVKELGVGASIDCSNDICIIDFVNSLNLEVINDYMNNAKRIPMNDLIYDPGMLLSKFEYILR